MAEDGELNLVQAIPEHADKILFIEDLVDFAVLINCPNYVVKRDSLPFREFVDSPFDLKTQTAVVYLERTLQTNIDELLTTIPSSDLCSTDFVQIAEKAADVYVPITKYFNARLFLKYSVSVSKLAAEFFNRGVLDAPQLAKIHIMKILQQYDMTTFRWYTVRRFSALYTYMLRVKIRKPEVIDADDSEFDSEYSDFDSESDSEIDPDEIETSSETQDEVNGDLLKNISLNQEQNGISENGKKNLEIQQERASSEVGRSCNKSGNFSSESSSDKSLHPLEKPKSSSK